MIGFFEEEKDIKSISRLCMLIGISGGVIAGIALIITWAWSQIEPNGWICIVPLSLMVGGCLPYIFNKLNEVKNKALENPELLKKIADVIKKI